MQAVIVQFRYMFANTHFSCYIYKFCNKNPFTTSTLSGQHLN